MLLWCKPGSIPEHCIMGELPRSSDTKDPVTPYLRKIVYKMLRRCCCVLERIRKQEASYLQIWISICHSSSWRVPISRGHTLPVCPQTQRGCSGSTIQSTVGVLPTMFSVLQNMVFSEVYLQDWTEFQYWPVRKCLRSTEVPAHKSCWFSWSCWGYDEFHQSQMTRQVVFLPTETRPRQRMLKNKQDLIGLEERSSDIYMSTRLDEYLYRPKELKNLTYPEFFKWSQA